MVISHRHRFLYFVVPKSASATLRESLSPSVDIGWPVSKYVQHQTVRQFLGDEHSVLFEDYFKFTFVRNPYDRLYSGYLQDRFAAENFPRWKVAKQPVFDAIGDDFTRYFHEHVANADICTDWRWICFCPMTEFACRDGQPAMDFVGRAEHLVEDMARLGDRLGITLDKAPDKNVRTGLCTTQPKYLDRYDRATVALVNRIYREDFALFGYEMLDPAAFPERVDPAGASAA